MYKIKDQLSDQPNIDQRMDPKLWKWTFVCRSLQKRSVVLCNSEWISLSDLKQSSPDKA